MTALVKNLFKIVVPLVNERCFGRPFSQHSRLARETVAAAVAWFRENPDERIFQRFPYPPTGDGDQKELYRLIKSSAESILADLDAEGLKRRRESRGPQDPVPGDIPRRPLRFPGDEDRRQRAALHHLHGQGVQGHPRAGHRLSLAHRHGCDLPGDIEGEWRR